MIEKALRAELAGTPAVSSLVSSRIYLQQRLQGSTLPAITFDVQRVEAIRTFAGASNLISAEVSVVAIADTYLAARDIADAVRGSLGGWTGASYGVNVLATRWVDESPQESGLLDGDENEPTQIEQQWVVHFEEL